MSSVPVDPAPVDPAPVDPAPMDPPAADAVFKALADPRRRALLDALFAGNGRALGALCVGLVGEHRMTRQAVMKHLAVLEAANLVVTVRRGREKLHYLNPVPIAEIADRWIAKFERGRLDALATLKRELENGER